VCGPLCVWPAVVEVRLRNQPEPADTPRSFPVGFGKHPQSMSTLPWTHEVQSASITPLKHASFPGLTLSPFITTTTRARTQPSRVSDSLICIKKCGTSILCSKLPVYERTTTNNARQSSIFLLRRAWETGGRMLLHQQQHLSTIRSWRTSGRSLPCAVPQGGKRQSSACSNHSSAAPRRRRAHLLSKPHVAAGATNSAAPAQPAPSASQGADQSLEDVLRHGTGVARRILSDPSIEGDALTFLKATEAYWKVGFVGDVSFAAGLQIGLGHVSMAAFASRITAVCVDRVSSPPMLKFTGAPPAAARAPRQGPRRRHL
jgi:hypothetical protein